MFEQLKSFSALFLLVSSILVIDQGSKWWAMSQGVAHINTGISFGLLGSQSVVFQIAIVLGMWGGLGWLLKNSGAQVKFLLIAVLTASFSNLTDRIRVGGVIDFLQVPFFNLSNNIADWVIFLGLGGIIVITLGEEHFLKKSETTSNS